MSLSILIPIYNYDVKNLVNDLHSQCIDLKIDFEILLVDDYSLEDFNLKNKKLESLSSVNYERLDNNIGRSKIRNYLVSKAKFSSCLILDCDIAIPSKFIEKYLKVNDLQSVIVGGHIYQDEPPTDKSLMLHWKYGTQVESKSINERLKKPYNSFMTNSFLVPKKLFETIKFDESIIKHGHEDTMFGVELKLKKIKIIHINNPVLHLGLKSRFEFLKGEKESIVNLIRLSSKKGNENIFKKSKLLTSEKNVLLNIYYHLTHFYYKNRLEKMLMKENPSLKLFTLWKYFNLKELRKSIGNK